MKKFLFPMIAGLLIVFTACKKDESYEQIEKTKSSIEEFKAFISGFTTGMISSNSQIIVQFQQPMISDSLIGEPLNERIFKIKPGINGKTFWINNYTIGFEPFERFESGTKYKVDFNLNKILKVPDNLKTFRFGFKTRDLSFKVEKGDLIAYNAENFEDNRYTGILLTNDGIEDHKELEKIISAYQDDKKLPVKWNHFDEMNRHEFIIENVKRRNKESVVTIKWDGKYIGVDHSGTDEIKIPALEEFKIMTVKTVNNDQQYVEIAFSDPLLSNQNLDGIVGFVGVSSKLIIDENILKIIPGTKLSGIYNLYILEGIKNIKKKPLKHDKYNTEIYFTQIEPYVELLGNGNIVPQSDGLILPFRAVNLSAVDMQIIQIYKNNVHYFLQMNELNGVYYINYVGRPILKKKIELTSKDIINYKTWNNFSIDISKHIQLEPGSIYRVVLSFKKDYSLYDCESNNEKTMDSYHNRKIDYSEWDYPNYYYEEYYYDEYYDWYESDYPCSSSYYANKFFGRNLISSNLGIIAKKGGDNVLTVAVNNILTTNPVNKVDVAAYNFQNCIYHA